MASLPYILTMGQFIELFHFYKYSLFLTHYEKAFKLFNFWRYEIKIMLWKLAGFFYNCMCKHKLQQNSEISFTKIWRSQSEYGIIMCVNKETSASYLLVSLSPMQDWLWIPYDLLKYNTCIIMTYQGMIWINDPFIKIYNKVWSSSLQYIPKVWSGLRCDLLFTTIQ